MPLQTSCNLSIRSARTRLYAPPHILTFANNPLAHPQAQGDSEMGTFHTKCKIENPTDRDRSLVVPKLLVDTGSEYTWVSERMLERISISREKKDAAFVLANGQEVTRSVGFAIIRLDKFFTIDEPVFAKPGDLQLLEARTLEGLNLIIEPARRRLVAAGPLPAASPTSPRLNPRTRRAARKRMAD